MPPLPAFSTPAKQQDLSGSAQEQLNALWSTHVEGFTQQAIVGDPWNSQFASDQTYYFNALSTDLSDASVAPVTWTAFPERLIQYLGVAPVPPPSCYAFDAEKILEAGDTGQYLMPIPSNHCPEIDWPQGCDPDLLKQLPPYGPYGPRGWLDEYCEWCVARDANGNILRVDFVCENPEYWYTLWRVDPDACAAIYEQALNAGVPAERQVTVSVEDLQLLDPSTGQPVIDPSTGQPAYNPLNKWNTGPVATRSGSAFSGGAMHLTSTPNTLQTELGLAGAATVLRNCPSDPQSLICCAQYGQAYRNSDPHIGASVNGLVASGYTVSLADPVGLYIQMPDFSSYGVPRTAPHGARAQDCWQIVRGAESLDGLPGNFILHAAFQIPPSWLEADPSLTVSDLTIDDSPIQWAGQIAQTMKIGLNAWMISAPTPAKQACVVPLTPPTVQPLQLFHADLWNAYYGTSVENPVDNPIPLASNTVIMPPAVEQGAGPLRMALTCSDVTAGQAPTVAFEPGDVTVGDVSAPTDVTYAVPGNSYPGTNQVITFEITVAPDAQLGLHSITVKNTVSDAPQPAPAFLNVVPAGSIGD